MATRERIGGAREDERRPTAPDRPAPGARQRASGIEAAPGVFPAGWWRGLFMRPKEPVPGGEIVYWTFAPGWWRHLFSRPKKPVPGGEIIYTAFAPGWWRCLFKRTPPQSRK